jgi:hypothetical protein
MKQNPWQPITHSFTIGSTACSITVPATLSAEQFDQWWTLNRTTPTTIADNESPLWRTYQIRRYCVEAIDAPGVTLEDIHAGKHILPAIMVQIIKYTEPLIREATDLPLLQGLSANIAKPETSNQAEAPGPGTNMSAAG